MNADRISQQFGRNLAEARGWAGLTQKQLGEQLSLYQADIAKFEGGLRCPRLDVVVRLAEAVGVQVRDLLFEIE
jgi:ribosome-binding protein aMBF1 (putative translation factor)